MPAGSSLNWAAAGMAGWGSTCGINIACAQFTEFALPTASTNSTIDKIFAHFAEGSHPFNADWFISGKAHPRAAVDFQVKYGSLQCHNVVVKHLNEKDFTDCGFADVRGEFCSTLVGAMLYYTMKQVGSIRGGFTAPTATLISSRRVGCSIAGCHDAPPAGGSTAAPRQMPGGFLPKEDCFACHK